MLWLKNTKTGGTLMKKIITALLALMLTTFLAGCEININIPNNNTGSSGANTEPSAIQNSQLTNTETEKTDTATNLDDTLNKDETSKSSETISNVSSHQTENTTSDTNSVKTTLLISTEKAKEIALNHAGVTNIREYKIELEKEIGLTYFEIEFESGNFEYSYNINAKTGKIITSKKEPEKENSAHKNDVPVSTPSVESSTFISKEKAKEIALNHAGVAKVREFEIELDKEMNVALFEIDFKSGNFEYSYEIDAKTGAVLKSEREIND